MHMKKWLLKDAQEWEGRYLMRTYKRKPVMFVRGEGAYLWDTEGKRYTDFVSGLGAVVAGHAHPDIAAAVADQAMRLVQVSNLYYTEPQLHLARWLVEKTFADRVFFCNSGAEANEGALKLARKYFRTVKNEERPDVICALGSFHGRTLATLKATGQPERWGPFEPLPQGFVHVPFNDLPALEDAVTERTCAVLLEPIQGEAGVKPASPEYLIGARRLCDRKGILLMLDEVQTGMGRTGALFAHQHYAVMPDIMSTAKGLANGLPIGAVLATEQVSAAFAPGDHGTTFGGGPVPCVAALATLEALTSGGLIHNAASAGECFRRRLSELQAKLPVITEVRGMGLMLALQLEAPIAEDVALGCLERGLVINDIGLHILRFLPPLLIGQEQIDELITALEELLEGAHAG